MKSASSYAVDQLAKPPMSTSLESLSVMSSNPCIDCRSFKSVKTLEDTPHQRSCNPPRPDHLPLEKELSVSTNFGNEQTKCKNVSSSADKHLDTYSFDSKTVLNSSVLASQTTSLSDHSNAPTPQAPLSFTNPLHSDDSDTEENNSYGSMTKSLSNISTASATVSAVSATESSSRKVVPMSIARHDKKHTSAEKDHARDQLADAIPDTALQNSIDLKDHLKTLQKSSDIGFSNSDETGRSGHSAADCTQ